MLEKGIEAVNPIRKYAIIGFAVVFILGILAIVIVRVISKMNIGQLKDDWLCAMTGLTMYCDPEKNEHASDISFELGSPYENNEAEDAAYSLKVRSVVQRFYEAINKPAFQEFSQLEDEICPLYKEMLALTDSELRKVAELYRISYNKTLRKEFGETFFECSSVQSLAGWVSPVFALYNAVAGVDNPGQDLLERLNELNIP